MIPSFLLLRIRTKDYLVWLQHIKVETIAKKVVVGSAVQRHGFVFDYTKAQSQTENESSSDEADSF